jgi:hypothetical protein
VPTQGERSGREGRKEGRKGERRRRMRKKKKESRSETKCKRARKSKASGEKEKEEGWRKMTKSEKGGVADASASSECWMRLLVFRAQSVRFVCCSWRQYAL